MVPVIIVEQLVRQIYGASPQIWKIIRLFALLTIIVPQSTINRLIYNRLHILFGDK
jgi:hypothetical protein